MDDPNTILRRVSILLGAATVVILLLAGFSSSLPDGLEAVAERIGHHGSDPVGGISLSDLFRRDWLAGLVGTAATGLLVWIVIAWSSRGRTKEGTMGD